MLLYKLVLILNDNQIKILFLNWTVIHDRNYMIKTILEDQNHDLDVSSKECV